MTTVPKLSRGIITLGAAALILAGCSMGPSDGDGEQSDNAATQSESGTDAPTEATSPPETATETPEPDLIDTFAIGESVQLPSADVTVQLIEEREVIPSDHPDFTPDFEPAEGERLWYLEIAWTNNTLDAVEKECHGPDMFDLQVYDVDGVEMLMVDQPGMIEGQNCATGLRQGETGTWLSAFNGGEADFGWALFTDYAGEDAVVTLDPALELVRNP